MQSNRRDTVPSSVKLTAGFAAVFIWSASAPAATVSRQTYVVSDFDTVRLEAPIDVTITTGKGSSAIGTGDRATLDALSLEINGRVLVIRINRSGLGAGEPPRGPTKLQITTGSLRRAGVVGAGRLTADRMKIDHGEASVQGSGSLAIGRIEADRLDMTLIGAGAMTLAGAALDATGTLSGSGRLDAADLTARRLRLNTEGSINVRIAAKDSATVVANGSGDVVITGIKACNVRAYGSATVSCSVAGPTPPQ